jgi:CRP-like cAMP-binding protein
MACEGDPVMPLPAPEARPERNRLLAALPSTDYERLARRLEVVRLEPGQVLLARGGPIEYVYFPRGAVVSVLVDLDDSQAIEGGSVGHEGMVGLAAAFDAVPAVDDAVCRIPGAAARMEARAFRAACKRSARLREVLQRYTLALMGQTARTVACTLAHPVEQRCARWLLTTHDRVGAEDFLLTHDGLAAMLGVRRPTLTVAAGRFQREGLIDYRRGRMRILDRARLQEAACDDYRRSQAMYDCYFPSVDGVASHDEPTQTPLQAPVAGRGRNTGC